MSTKHLFNTSEGLVVKSLRGLISYNPALALNETDKVVYNTAHSTSQVSIISGGGSGHEPAFAGFVGEGMLAASVAGDIFASPSTKQILGGIEAVPSDKGTLLVVLNYTGDCLNFGLASEKANAKRPNSCGVLIVGDDVSVPNGGGLVGRRGLASQVAVIKIVGAAAEQGESLADLVSLGKAVADQSASLAVTLDHCHVPGRTEHDKLSENEIELGTGPHNETGYKKISPVPSTEELLANVLKHILDETDQERGYVQFSPDDETVLLVNNFGGISPLEVGALTDEVLHQLQDKYKVEPVRVYAGSILTSLNAPAFSISIINLTKAAKNARRSLTDIKSFLDLQTRTQWEAAAGSQTKRRARKEQIAPPPKQESRTIKPDQDLKVEPAVLEAMVRKACDNVIKAEPDLTDWDTVMGDGDCGETLKTGATAMLASLDSGIAKQGSVITVLHELESIVESKMGGTLGAILAIFSVSLTAELQQNAKAMSSDVVGLWAKAMASAISHLGRYTPAKAGDRTVMDALIPFAESLKNDGSSGAAVTAAKKAVEGTRTMKPKLGRATYIGGMEGKDLPPDPGAWGIMEVISGLYEGMNT